MLRLQLGIRQSVGHMSQPTVGPAAPQPATHTPTPPASTRGASGGMAQGGSQLGVPVTLAPASLRIQLSPTDFTYKAKVFFPSAGR
jgi:hypothetical protein